MSAAGGQGPASPEPSPASRGPWARDVALLLALSAWLAGVRLAEPGLVDPDEPRSALIARLMVERGDWLAPHLPATFRYTHPRRPLDGGLFPYWDKPPLYFWLSAAAMRVLGPTALAARLPSALGQVAAVLLVYAAGRHLWGRRAGLLAGAVMASAPLPVVMAHVARMESLLAALLALAILAVLRLLEGPTGRRRWAWTIALYGALGLAVLTKGPVALVIAGGAVLLTAAVSGRWRDLVRVRPLIGAAIVAAMAAPWFIYMGLRFPSASPCEAGFAEQGAAGDAPGFLHEFFIGEHVGRATRAGFGRHLAPGILVGILLVGFFPWTLLVPGMVRETLVSAWRRRRTRPGPLLVFIWAGLVVLLFSLSRTQMLHYVLPAFPALALAAGGYLSDALSRPVASSLRPCVPSSLRFALWACAPLGAGGAAALAAIHTVGGGGPMPIVLLAAAMAAVAAASVACLLRRREDLSLALVPAGAAVLITFTFATDPFAVYSAFTTRPQAEIIRASVRPGDAVLSYGHTPYSLAWYLWPREVPCPTKTGKPWEAPSLGALVAQLNGPRRTFCLLRKKGLVEVLRPQVRWPLEVLSRSERSTLIVTAPPPGETSGPLLPASDIHTRIP